MISKVPHAWGLANSSLLLPQSNPPLLGPSYAEASSCKVFLWSESGHEGYCSASRYFGSEGEGLSQFLCEAHVMTAVLFTRE